MGVHFLQNFGPPSFHPIAWTPATAFWKTAAMRVALVATPLFITYAIGARWVRGLGIAVLGLSIFELYRHVQARFPSSVTLTSRELISCPPSNMDPKKHAIYRTMHGLPLPHEKITLTTIPPSQLPSTDLNILAHTTQFKISPNLFSYKRDVSQTVELWKNQWWVDFGSIRNYTKSSGLRTQSDLLTAEHPTLLCVSAYFQQQHPNQSLLPGQALLVEGAFRYGAIDNNLFGDPFERASEKDVEKACFSFLKNHLPIIEDKICVICPPPEPEAGPKSPYQEEEFAGIFRTAYTAFSAIVKKNPEAEISTNNWGCRWMDGHPRIVILLQLAAANFAGVKRLHYSRLPEEAQMEKETQQEVQDAMTLFENIKYAFTKPQRPLTPSALFSYLT